MVVLEFMNELIEQNQEIAETFSAEEKTQRKKDIILVQPIIWSMILTSVCVFGRDSFLSSLSLPDFFYHAVRYGIPAALLVYAFCFIDKKYIIWFSGLALFLGTSYSFAFIQDNFLREELFLYIITTFLICIPATIFVASIKNYEILYSALKICSFIVSGISIYYIFNRTDILYSMSASYQILWCSVLHVNEVFIKDKDYKSRLFYIALSIFEFSAIFIRGARGPLVCFMFYVLCKVIIEARRRRSNSFILAGLVIVGIFAAVNLTVLEEWGGDKLDQMGLYSRNLNSLLTETIFDESEREILRDQAYELIQEKPFLGYGASSDAKLLNGKYVHSLPLELAMDFGIIVGGGIFLVVCALVIRTLFSESSIKRDLKLIFLTEGFVMLFMSGTYLQSVFFFAFIGLAISDEYEKKGRTTTAMVAGT